MKMREAVTFNMVGRRAAVNGSCTYWTVECMSNMHASRSHARGDMIEREFVCQPLQELKKKACNKITSLIKLHMGSLMIKDSK